MIRASSAAQFSAPTWQAANAVHVPRTTPGEIMTSPDVLARLYAEALLPSENRWPASRDIADARNAHFTNRPGELLAALQGRFDYFEGDVRRRPHGELVMAHGVFDRGVLSLDEWLKIGHASGRGLKLDFKSSSAIIESLERARKLGVPDSHLVINVSVKTSDSVLGQVRALYPRAWVNLSPHAPYDAAMLRMLAEKSRTTGGKVQFPMDWRLITPAIVKALLPYGRVAIWNDPAKAAPIDIDAETARLRSMGVNGTIDLRRRA